MASATDEQKANALASYNSIIELGIDFSPAKLGMMFKSLSAGNAAEWISKLKGLETPTQIGKVRKEFEKYTDSSEYFNGGLKEGTFFAISDSYKQMLKDRNEQSQATSGNNRIDTILRTRNSDGKATARRMS